MRSMGLEPTRLAAQEPKSCMSANFIMTAYIVLCSFSALSLLFLCFYSALGNAFERGLESEETSLDDKSPPPVKRVVRDAGYKPALLASA